MARSLGFSGYSELRLALAVAGAAPGATATLTGDITRDDDLDVAVAKLAAAEEKALRATVSQLDIDALRQVVEAIVHASPVGHLRRSASPVWSPPTCGTSSSASVTTATPSSRPIWP